MELCLSIYLSAHLSFRLCLIACLSPVCFSVSGCISVWLSVYLSACQVVCPYVCLYVYSLDLAFLSIELKYIWFHMIFYHGIWTLLMLTVFASNISHNDRYIYFLVEYFMKMDKVMLTLQFKLNLHKKKTSNLNSCRATYVFIFIHLCLL